MTTLGAIVDSHSTMASELPLIHTSRCESLTSIAASHTLDPSPCDIFNESLVYLFYGRPAYRSRRGSKYGESIALCPVCLVFKPHTVSRFLHRVFPCDSGAVSKAKFEPELHANDLAELEMNPQIASARRLVSLLFTNNNHYFYGRVQSGAIFPDGTVGKRYHDLLLRSGPSNYDDRKSAIEVQVNQRIALKDQLMFVVLPREFLEEEMIKKTIVNTWNCDAVGYPTFCGDAPTRSEEH